MKWLCFLTLTSSRKKGFEICRRVTVFTGISFLKRHGFKKENGRTKNSVDICVVYKEGGILLRFKDNCRPFDPSERQSIFTPEDVTANIGIRMISLISKRMEYRFVLGLNVLSVWV